jgi:hypothetical protein
MCAAAKLLPVATIDPPSAQATSTSIVALGRHAGVGTVVLFHHGHVRTDDEIDAIVARFTGGKPSVIAAAEGLTIDLG